MRNSRTTSEPGCHALKRGAALVPHPGRVVLRLTGKDPAGMLNAVLTNDVPEDERLGAYALLLDPKGRVRSDLRIVKDEGAILAVVEPKGAAAARETLGRYAPFSRVEVGEAPMKVLGLYGPRAKEVLGLDLAEHESGEVDLGGTSVLAVGVSVPAVGFDLIFAAEDAEPVRDHLLSLGATEAAPDEYETIRIAAGVPRFGSDVTPENFPAEAGLLDRAVSFSKGCYPGQETVARMHYRGQPNKNLYRLVLEGEAPEPGTPILQNEKQVGYITSVAPKNPEGETLALGYLKRSADPDGSLLAGNSTARTNGLADPSQATY